MYRVIFLSCVAMAAALSGAFAEIPLPNSVEITSLVLPSPDLAGSKNQVAVVVRFEVSNFKFRAHDYLVVLTAFDETPRGEGAQVLLDGAIGTVPVRSRWGSSIQSVPIDVLVAAGTSDLPVTLQAHILEGRMTSGGRFEAVETVAESAPVTFHPSF